MAIFIESIENEYGSIDVYYEETNDLFTLYIEKSHQSPENKKKQQELLKKLNYDPKTKTIEVDGHKTQFRIDRKDPDAAHIQCTRSRKSKKALADKYADSSKYNDAKLRKKDPGKFAAGQQAYKKNTTFDGYGSGKRAHTLNFSGSRNQGVFIGKNKMDEDTILHEVGHVRDMSNRRRANAEPSFVAKYGTKELPKEVRYARLELNKLKKKAETDKLSYAEKTRIKKLENTIQKGIESTETYKNDKGQQRRDTIEKADKDIEKTINRKRRKLNKHDKSTNEYYADAYAKKHSTTNSNMHENFTNDYRSRIDRLKSKEGKKGYKKELFDEFRKKERKKYGMTEGDVNRIENSKLAPAIASVARHLEINQNKKFIKSTKTRKKIADRTLKNHYDAIESVQDIDDLIASLAQSDS